MEKSIEKLNYAKQYAERFISNPDVNSVFIGGSLTAGLGSPTSDVDLFVLVNNETALQETWQAVIKKSRIDVEVYSLEKFRSMLDDVLRMDDDKKSIFAARSMRTQMDLIARFKNSTVVKQSAELALMKKSLESRERFFRSFQTNYWALIVEAVKEDFLGSVIDEDFSTAALLGQNLLTAAGKAFVSAGGDSYFGEKWVYKQLKRSGISQQLLDAYFVLQTGDWVRDGKNGAIKLLDFAQSLVMCAQVQNAACSGEKADLELFLPAISLSVPNYRNPAFGVFRIEGKNLMHWELHKDITLSNRMLCLLGLCGGRDSREVLRLVRSNEAIAKMVGDIGEKEMQSFIDKFVELQLLLTSKEEILSLIES